MDYHLLEDYPKLFHLEEHLSGVSSALLCTHCEQIVIYKLQRVLDIKAAATAQK